MQTKTPQKRPGIVRRAAAFITRKAFDLIGIARSSWFLGLTAMGWGDRSYEGLKAGTLANPYAARAYQLIVNAVRSIEWLAYTWGTDEKGGPKLDEKPDHPFLEVLKKPSMGVSASRFVAEAFDHLFFGGEIITYAPESPITGTNAGKPGASGLLLLRPDRIVRITRTDDAKAEPVTYHYRTWRGTIDNIPAGRVRRFYAIEDPERPGRGWPLAAAAARTVELMREGEDWQGSLFRNKGRHPGFFSFDGTPGQTMDEPSFDRFKAELQESYAADRDAGMPGLLENVKWLPNGMSPKEAESVAVELQGMRRIAVAWGVMTPLLGDAQNMTYENLRTSIRALLALTALPLLEWFQTEMTAAYMGMYTPEDAFLGYDADAIEELQEDTTALYDRALKASGRPFISANEARAMAKFERLETPESDILWAPVNVVPVTGEEEDMLEGEGSDNAGNDGQRGSAEELALNLGRRV